MAAIRQHVCRHLVQCTAHFFRLQDTFRGPDPGVHKKLSAADQTAGQPPEQSMTAAPDEPEHLSSLKKSQESSSPEKDIQQPNETLVADLETANNLNLLAQNTSKATDATEPMQTEAA